MLSDDDWRKLKVRTVHYCTGDAPPDIDLGVLVMPECPDEIRAGGLAQEWRAFCEKEVVALTMNGHGRIAQDRLVLEYWHRMGCPLRIAAVTEVDESGLASLVRGSFEGRFPGKRVRGELRLRQNFLGTDHLRLPNLLDITQGMSSAQLKTLSAEAAAVLQAEIVVRDATQRLRRAERSGASASQMALVKQDLREARDEVVHAHEDLLQSTD